MATFKKSYAVVLAALAFSLTFMGIVLAATDPNPAHAGAAARFTG